MSDSLTVTSQAGLKTLAERIREEHESVIAHARDAIEHGIRCGLALLEARERVPRGGWLLWCDRSLPITPNTARQYMHLAEHRELIRSQDNLTAIRHALQLLRDRELIGQNVRLSDAQRHEMRQLREQGMSIPAIAERFGVEKSTVHRWAGEGESMARRQINPADTRDGRSRKYVIPPSRVEIDDAMIDRMAGWLVLRMMHLRVPGYPRRVTDVVRREAHAALKRALEQA